MYIIIEIICTKITEEEKLFKIFAKSILENQFYKHFRKIFCLGTIFVLNSNSPMNRICEEANTFGKNLDFFILNINLSIL